jgi:tripartite-type tricarboxylate transporter receptor subunit TctC
MIRKLSKLLCSIVVVTTAALGLTETSAQQRYPDRSVRLIVPAAPGSSPDAMARIMSTKLGEMWGHPLVIENVVGAGGIIGHDRATKSKPDGYTLLMGLIGPMSVSSSLGEKMPFDPKADLAPVSLLLTLPNILVVHPNVPAKNLGELIAHAKQNPGKLRYGFPGPGTSSHLSSELFNEMAGTKVEGISYKASAQMVTDLIGGHVEMMFLPIPQVLQHVRSGALRGIAVSSKQRSSIAPDIPTLDEAGLSGYEVTPWFAMYAPAGTPSAIITKLNADLTKMFAMPEVKAWVDTQAGMAGGGTPEALAAFQASETTKWQTLTKALSQRNR